MCVTLNFSPSLQTVRTSFFFQDRQACSDSWLFVVRNIKFGCAIDYLVPWYAGHAQMVRGTWLCPAWKELTSKSVWSFDLVSIQLGILVMLRQNIVVSLKLWLCEVFSLRNFDQTSLSNHQPNPTHPRAKIWHKYVSQAGTVRISFRSSQILFRFAELTWLSIICVQKSSNVRSIASWMIYIADPVLLCPCAWELQELYGPQMPLWRYWYSSKSGSKHHLL